MRNYSPAAAAKVAGVSRSLIARALSDQTLKGTKKNNGHWTISDAALEAWMSTQTFRKPTEKTVPKQDHSDLIDALKEQIAELKKSTKSDADHERELGELKADLSGAKAKIEGLEARLETAEAERDRYAKLAGRSLWRMIFG